MDALELSNRMSYVHETGCPAVAGLRCECVTREARATVARLTEENAKLIIANADVATLNIDLHDENQRYREALEDMLNIFDRPGTAPRSEYQSIGAETCDNARAALAQRGEEQG